MIKTQWNPFTVDTLVETASGVLISEVSPFQGLFSAIFYAAGTRESVPIEEVLSSQGCPYEGGSYCNANMAVWPTSHYFLSQGLTITVIIET